MIPLVSLHSFLGNTFKIQVTYKLTWNKQQ